MKREPHVGMRCWRAVSSWVCGIFLTIYYAVMEIRWLCCDFFLCVQPRHLLLTVCSLLPVAVGLYWVDGPHGEPFKKLLWWHLWWVWLGILSSVCFGTGLHTFVLNLGPHIAKVTLAAFECNSLNFPEPPYPTDVTCPVNGKPHLHESPAGSISIWEIIAKVQVESILWGIGTAIGELPPYFVAKAARHSENGLNRSEEHDVPGGENFFGKANRMVKKLVDTAIRKAGFWGILLFASVPNPFFDFAGLTCGHFGVPFTTFFGATLLGKALIKIHFQMLCVIVAFSEHHAEKLVSKLELIPYAGKPIQAPLKEFLHAQKLRLHGEPTDPISEQTSSKFEMVMQFVMVGMIVSFLVSLINSLAQRYRKRCVTQERG